MVTIDHNMVEEVETSVREPVGADKRSGEPGRVWDHG